MSDSARDWVVKLTVSKPDTAEREMARRALVAYFDRTSSVQAVSNFLDLAVGASPRQKRVLADLIAPYVTLGESWLMLLEHADRRWARRAARRYLRAASDAEVGLALLHACQRAVQNPQMAALLTFLPALTVEVAAQRPGVPLRAVERYLKERLATAEKRPRWRREPIPSWFDAFKAMHAALESSLAPHDAPLPSLAPTLGADGLPIPSEGSATSAANLPTPATCGAVGASQPWWKRWIKRFRP